MHGSTLADEFNMISKANSNTFELLRLISTHISYREDLKGREIHVKISKPSRKKLKVVIQPEVLCYPSIHNRKQSDRQTLVEHIMSHHNISEPLVLGNYSYAYLFGKKTRSWIKVEESL